MGRAEYVTNISSARVRVLPPLVLFGGGRPLPNKSGENIKAEKSGEMNVLSGKSYLSAEFNCKEYLDSLDPAINPHEENKTDFRWKQMYSFYAKYNSKWNNKTARLLEFGGGPVIVNLISAVPYVNQIIFSAHAESERKEIELWKNKEEGAHDWSPHFQAVVNKVEQIAGDDAWREREELLRKRITNIIPCDIRCDDPLLTKQEPFEIISTSLCLEAACSTYIEYKEAVKKLVALLKPGGFLFMITHERETFYMFGGKKWSGVWLTLELVKEALSEAGMVILVAERDPASMEQIQNPVTSDFKAVAYLASQKVVF